MSSFSEKYDFAKTVNRVKESSWLEISKKNSFVFEETILLPPPNITGKLHLGHALDSVLQDFIVRRSFLKKKPVKWIAGIDHAGISAQNKIEKMNFPGLNDSESKKNFALSIWYPDNRKKFYSQWKNLGLMIDYESAKFTLDDDVQKQVMDAFIILYNDGFIEKGPRIVNWDPELKSVISDIEVEHKEIKGKIYFIKYKILGENSFLVVATSRPETIFADRALFLNPEDNRYKKFHNKSAINPITEEIIPILLDKNVKMDFGSGVLKCTPAHDVSDYELGLRYNLEVKSCCDENGVLNEISGKWRGKKINEIRENLVNELEEKGILMKLEDYDTTILISSKSGCPIEHIVSNQWFLDLPSLVRKIEDENRDLLKSLEIVPRKFDEIIKKWKSSLKKWCISRQLWWGHRIPAWYHKKSKELYVGKESPGDDWERETDVLDTWFSSSLWPLLSLARKDEKFPSNKEETYPISILVTGYDIIFFWVLRMIILLSYFCKKPPFRKVFLHGLIRDSLGKKMSKSLDNGIDPDQLIKKYGCDSLRFFLLKNSSWGNDLSYDENKLVGSWRFCQKLWSLANLILAKVDSDFLVNFQPKKISLSENDVFDNWVMEKISNLQTFFREKLEKENLWEIGKCMFETERFIREDFSSGYVELMKVFDWKSKHKKSIILFIFHQVLLALHPAIPFLTDEIYNVTFKKNILESNIIEIEGRCLNKENDSIVNHVLELLNSVRSLKRNKHREFLVVINEEFLLPIRENKIDLERLITSFSGNNKFRISYESKSENEEFREWKFADSNEFMTIFHKDKVNEKELSEKLNFFTFEWERSKKILMNNDFLHKAPSSLIDKEKEKYAYYLKKKREIEMKIEKKKDNS